VLGVKVNIPEALSALNNALVRSGYTFCTIKNYMGSVHKFLEYSKGMKRGEKPEYYVNGYVFRMRSGGMGATTINLMLAAIRFFFKEVKGYLLTTEVKYMKEPKKLPTVFSVEEIEKILSVKMNPKHRLLIMMYYGCGLRLSETIHIKIKNISLDRKTICIFGKGMKDRIVSIKDFQPGTIEAYMVGKKPDDYLIESEATGGAITKRTAQKVFENACLKAGVSTPWNIHRLRHSYACHLLENGTDVSFIQKLLGHSNIKTTMIYCNVSNDAALKVKSPLVGLKVAMA
jgi:integrase/recombinase XerD